jgi:predicted transcriptional regulator
MKKSRQPQNRTNPGVAELDPIVVELNAVKRLLVLLLIKAGTKQGEIAMALGVAQSSVSGMFPSRKVKRFQEETGE